MKKNIHIHITCSGTTHIHIHDDFIQKSEKPIIGTLRDPLPEDYNELEKGIDVKTWINEQLSGYNKEQTKIVHAAHVAEKISKMKRAAQVDTPATSDEPTLAEVAKFTQQVIRKPRKLPKLQAENAKAAKELIAHLKHFPNGLTYREIAMFINRRKRGGRNNYENILLYLTMTKQMKRIANEKNTRYWYVAI
jgi:hypothetical protein